MNPSDAHSSLATLRQLKEMLDAGTLTPQEFEALKQKLVFGTAATPAINEPAAMATDFVAPVAISEALTSAPAFPGEVSLPPSPPEETPAWLAAPVRVDSPNAPLESDYAELDASDNQRNPLNLIFAIGGALVFLAVVLYLTLGNRSADEHLTSTTQTAADSAAVAPEIGPQAQQLTLPPATPETVRVAPAAPLVAAPAAATKFRPDSVAAAKAPSQPTKTVTLPEGAAATDSTTLKQP